MSTADAQPHGAPDQVETPAPPARWGLILGVLGLLGLAWVVFLMTGEVGHAIRKLYAQQPETRREGEQILRGHDDRPAVIERLVDTVTDTDVSYSVRKTCARLLKEFEQLPRLEALVKHEEPGVRYPVLDVLARENYFQSTYVDDPAYGVRETVRTWIQDDKAPARFEGVNLLRRIGIEGELPVLRSLLTRSKQPNVHPDSERQKLLAALAAIAQAKDCESVPAAVALAQSDPHHRVRHVALKTVEHMAFGSKVCPNAVTEDDMRGLIDGALRDRHAHVRQAAVLILRDHPNWAAASRETLHALLNNTHEGFPVRRAALETLSKVRDDAFEQDLPRWFHDPSPFLRSSAVTAAGGYDPPTSPFLGCLIGIVRNERESDLAYDTALDQLRRASSEGFKSATSRVESLEKLNPQKVHEAIRTFFKEGQAHGVTRHQFAEAWFAWWVEHRGFTGEAGEAALNRWRAFWTHADNSDTAGAKSALEDAPEVERVLYLNERAWLAAHGG